MNILIPVPEDWRDRFKAAAEARGESLSEFIRTGAWDRLTPKERKGLSDPPKMGRPKKQE